MTENKGEIKLNEFGFPTEKSIFHYNLEELIYAKYVILFERLQPALNDYAQAEIDYKDAVDVLMLTTDFKAEGLTNDKMRTAYVNQELKEDKKQLNELKTNVEVYKNQITILNDLINLRRIELKLEMEKQEE